MLKLKKYGWLLFLVGQIIVISILKQFPEFIEAYYSNGIFVFISKLMRYSFGWIPFSVGDVLYTLAGIYIIRWLILNFKRIYKDPLNWLLDITAVVALAYFAFHVLWAFNYYRLPLHEALDIEAEYTTEDLVSLTDRLISKSNKVHSQLSENDSIKVTLPYTKQEIFDKVSIGYDKLSQRYPHLTYEPTSLKTSLYSLPLTYMGFSGYLNPFTIEAQVDGLIPIYKFPTTACHEVAHQIGYAAENEANFFGALAAINNPDIYFQYSGYTFALRYCLIEIYKRDKPLYERFLKTIHPGILKNYDESRQFWLKYENPLEPVFKVTYDSFLKANNQQDGMKSYSYVVALLVNYYKNQEL